MRSPATRAYATREGIELLLILIGMAVASRLVRLPWWLWLTLPGGKVLFSLAFYILLLHRVFRQRPTSGPGALVDVEAITLAPLQPHGQVLVRGEIWQASGPPDRRIERGERVRILTVEGRVLRVGPRAADNVAD